MHLNISDNFWKQLLCKVFCPVVLFTGWSLLLCVALFAYLVFGVLPFCIWSNKSSAGGDGRFEVDRKTGQVRTTGLPLQRDREYLLTVVAADRLGSRSAPAVISVVAGPRPPQFTNASFTIAIPENTPEGQPWVYTHSSTEIPYRTSTWNNIHDIDYTHTHLLFSFYYTLPWLIFMMKNITITLCLKRHNHDGHLMCTLLFIYLLAVILDPHVLQTKSILWLI